MSKRRTFNEDEKKVVVEELNKLQREYLDALTEKDDDEDSRERLFIISFLKNVFVTGQIDNLQIDFNDDICEVNVD